MQKQPNQYTRLHGRLDRVEKILITFVLVEIAFFVCEIFFFIGNNK